MSVADVYPHSLSSASSSKVYVGSTGISEGDDTIKDDLVHRRMTLELDLTFLRVVGSSRSILFLDSQSKTQTSEVRPH